MIKALVGGFVGAATLTLLHEYLKKYKFAPRLDKLGEEAAASGIEALGGDAPGAAGLYTTSLAADIISNTLYYSSAAAHPTKPVQAGIGLGLLAGIGAVFVPGEVGLSSAHTAATPSRKWITVALYTVGGLVAGAVIKRLSK